jgi:hypothetical protein
MLARRPADLELGCGREFAELELYRRLHRESRDKGVAICQHRPELLDHSQHGR